MKLGLGEILEHASTLKTRKDRVDYLLKNDSKSLRDIIQYALHPAITWDLPEGSPPYKPCVFLDQEGMLYQEIRRLYLFCNGKGSHLPMLRLESLFVQILESIAPKDAELLLLVKERKLPKGLTPSVIDQTWPGLIPNEADQKVS
jgi:hypothetical protein